MAAMAPPTAGPPVESIPNKRPEIMPGLQATCPMICAVVSKSGGPPAFVPLPMKTMNVKIECHIATGFVTTQFVVDVPHNVHKCPAVLFVPKDYDATISELVIRNLVREVMYATLVIPNDDAQAYDKSNTGAGSKAGMPELGKIPGLDTSNPELFSLMLGSLVSGDQLEVTLTWFQPLLFDGGIYKLNVPTTLLPQVMTATNANQIMNVSVVINTGIPEQVTFYVPYHPVLAQQPVPGTARLTADNAQIWSNMDFEFGYKVWGKAIVASTNVQPPKPPAPDNKGYHDPRGTFALTVSPPSPQHAGAFQRSVVFLVDRSGSMTGEPIKYARNAILTGIRGMAESDEFAIIAYDHEQLMFSNQMVSVDAASKQAASEWVMQYVTARGLTDILTPLRTALALLEQGKGVPYIFLLTDGAVANEREICEFMDQVQKSETISARGHARLSTFAIGPFCNHFFLKQLATLAKGQFDVAFRPTNIQTQMERMLMAAARPVLTNVTLGIEGLQSCELYPFPVPDLFCGLPLIVSGKFEGQWPAQIQVNGNLPGGQPWSQSVQTTQNAEIPLDKVFVKQRLDVLTASAWLTDDPKAVAEVVKLSVATGVPCAHTTMVGFECTPAKYQELQQQRKAGKKVNIGKFALAGAAGVAVIGGVALAVGFGDIGASLGNADIFGAIGDGAAGAAEGLGDLAEGVGDCCGDCFGEIGECFESVGDMCGDLVDCL